jgi:hypothetical protein
MGEVFTVVACLFSVGVFMLLLLDPSHEACKPEVRK